MLQLLYQDIERNHEVVAFDDLLAVTPKHLDRIRLLPLIRLSPLVRFYTDNQAVRC
jgi:hypothetical protein